MIFGMTYYQICMYFLIYSFLGWCVEVVFHALKQGKVVNRGFLNGPVCPVYGFGMLAVIAMFNELPKNEVTQEPNPWLVFLGGMILTTLIEFIAGFILYHCFHARWWDYSRMPGNIGGYICPLFSILWGMACVLIMKLVHPLTQNLSDHVIPSQYGWPVMLILYVIYMIDLIATILTVSGFNRKLRQLDELDKKLRTVSDGLSDVLGETTIKTNEKAEEGRVQAELAREDLKDQLDEKVKEARFQHEVRVMEHDEEINETAEKIRNAQNESRKKAEEYRKELQDRYEQLRKDLVSHTRFGTGRLLKAFPGMKHRDYESLVNELKEYQQKREHQNH